MGCKYSGSIQKEDYMKNITIAILASLYLCHAQAACLDLEKGSSADELQKNRVQCLNQARFLLPTIDSATAISEEFRKQLIQPLSKNSTLVNDSTVHCRFVYQKQNGDSAKFRCAKTNETNQLYSSKGDLIEQAVGTIDEEDDIFLIDQNGQKISEAGKKDGKEKFLKSDILKVRYQDGGSRNVENYTSAAVSRILWALQIPAHSNYMTEKVVCFGCNTDPFNKSNPLKSAVIQDGKYALVNFADANIEVKFQAKRLYDPTQQPWKWTELNALHRKSSLEIKKEIEVLALVGHFVGITSTSDMQNAIVCTKSSEQNKKECQHVIGMYHDLGAGLGKRGSKGFSADYPRGDLSAYKNTTIFGEGTCNFLVGDGKKDYPLNISSRGRDEFIARAKSLTRDNLKIIFKASHIGNLKNDKKKNTDELELQWADAVLAKVEEVKNAPCN